MVLMPIYVFSFLFHAETYVLVIFNCKCQHLKHFRSTLTSVIIFILIFRLINICYYNTTFKCDRLDLFCNWPHLVLFTKSYYYCGIVAQMPHGMLKYSHNISTFGTICFNPRYATYVKACYIRYNNGIDTYICVFIPFSCRNICFSYFQLQMSTF